MNDEKEKQQKDDESLNSFSGDAAVRAEAAREAGEEKRSKQAHKRRNHQKRKENRRFFRLIWWVMIIIVSAVVAKYMLTGMNDLLAIGRSSATVTVEIPESVTEKEVSMSQDNIQGLSFQQVSAAKQSNQEVTRQIAQILQKAGVINEPDFFCLYSKIRKADGSYRNGSFEVKTDLDYEGIINTIQSTVNRKDIVKVTVPEGLDAMELGTLLEQNGICKQEDFLKELNTDAFDSSYTMINDLNGVSGKYYKLEGYLFPDTYQFYQNEDVQNVVQKMLQNANSQFTQQLQDEAKNQGYTWDQIITLASIIQAESANEEDMYNVSSVLHNRLNSGKSLNIYTLDCDSTKYYPYRTKEDIPEDQRNTYLSNYNTYQLRGLPAGAVCNPGLKAIQAALHPNNTSYYYFCHNQTTGQAYYASTYAEHQANLRTAGLL